jgi:hypothetical protein
LYHDWQSLPIAFRITQALPVAGSGRAIRERVDELAPERRKIMFDPFPAWTASTPPGFYCAATSPTRSAIRTAC